MQRYGFGDWQIVSAVIIATLCDNVLKRCKGNVHKTVLFVCLTPWPLLFSIWHIFRLRLSFAAPQVGGEVVSVTGGSKLELPLQAVRGTAIEPAAAML